LGSYDVGKDRLYGDIGVGSRMRRQDVPEVGEVLHRQAVVSIV